MSTPEAQREMDDLLFAENVPTRLAGEHLVATAARELGVTPVEAAESGWRLLEAMVRVAGSLDERGRDPYVAARHLLGLVEYPTNPQEEIPYTRGQTWEALKRHDGTMFRVTPPSFPLTKGRREVLAALGGKYGRDRTLWRGGTRHQLTARITEDFIAVLEAATAEPASVDEPSVSTALPSRGLRERRWQVLAGVAVFAALVASALWVGLGPSSSDSDRPQAEDPGGTESSYWEAGWGPPDRDVFSLESGGSPYPSFNAISDNPNFGDERNFVALKDKRNLNAGGWVDDIWAEPGDVILARAYVNNSGGDAPDVELPYENIQSARLEVGTSEGTREFSVYGILSGVNATGIWDGATIHVDEGVSVEFDRATARYTTNAHPDPGLKLSDELFESPGSLLGYEELDGVIRPGYQYAGIFTIEIAVRKK